MSRRLFAVAASLAVTVIVAGGVASTGASEPWRVLGERTVNDRIDHDVVACAGDGPVTALKLAVRKRPVHFLDVKVHFGNGEVLDVAVRSLIPAGGETRVLDLPGGERVVTRVELWYEAQSIGRGKKARVLVLGRR